MSSRRRPSPWALGAAGVTVLALALVYLATDSEWYYADDYLNFFLVSGDGLSGQLLKTSYFGTFAPGHRFLDWTIVDVLGIHWAVAVGISLLLLAAAAAAFWALVRCFVSRPWAFGLTAVFVLSPVFVRVIQWYANAGHVMPATALTLLALAAAMRWSATPRPRLLVVVALAHAGALCFYGKPLLIVGYVVLLTCFVRVPERLGPASVWRAVRAHAPLLAVVIGVTVVYLVIRQVGAYSELPPTGADATAWSQYLRLSWTRGVSPILLGQTVPYQPIGGNLRPSGTASDLVLVVAQLLLVGAAALSVALRPAAWRAWAAYVVWFLANVALVGIGRLGPFSPGLGADARYVAEFAFLLPLTFALAFTAPVVGPGFVRARHAALRLRPGRRAGLALGAVALVLFAISSVNSGARLADEWPADQADDWANAVRDSGDALPRTPRPSVLNTTIPESVEPGGVPPFDQAFAILPLFGVHADIGGALGPGPLYLLEPAGTLRRPDLTRVGTSSIAQLRRSGRLVISANGGRIEQRGGATCVTAAATSAFLTFDVPDIPLGYLVVRAQLQAGPAATLWYYVDRGTGFAEPHVELATAQGAGRVDLGIEGPLTAVRLDVQPGSQLCLRSLTLDRAT